MSGILCVKTILNCFALEHSAFKTKHLKVSLRHGIRLIFSSDNPEGFSHKNKRLIPGVKIHTDYCVSFIFALST